MEITEVNTKQMEALKALSDTTLKISEAKGLLQKLEEDETKYLVLREGKVIDRIQAIVADSQKLLEEAAGNYEKVKAVYDLVCTFVDLLSRAHHGFTEYEAAALEKIRLEETKLDNILVEIDRQRRDMMVQKVKLENWETGLKEREVKLGQDVRKYLDDKGALDRVIKRLKDGRI